MGCEAPGAVEHVVFKFVRGVEAAAAFAHDDVAGGASAAHVAGVLDVDAVIKQGLGDAGASGDGDFCAFGAVFGVG